MKRLVMTFTCHRCGKRYTDKVQTRALRDFIRKHLLNLCTRQGVASMTEMQRIWHT